MVDTWSMNRRHMDSVNQCRQSSLPLVQKLNIDRSSFQFDLMLAEIRELADHVICIALTPSHPLRQSGMHGHLWMFMMFIGGGQLLQVPNNAANSRNVSENGVIEMELQPLMSNNVSDT